MTKDIMQIMERREEIRKARNEAKEKFNAFIKDLDKQEAYSIYLEKLFSADINIHFVQIAEPLLVIYGDGVTSSVEGRILTEEAAVDIATGCKHLKLQFFGNKRYEGFYQSHDSKYGYGPSHGTTVDYVGLRNPKVDLTKEEQEACIYYLKNYKKIKEIKSQ